jgi:thiamine biosynthesis lipoprotein
MIKVQPGVLEVSSILRSPSLTSIGLAGAATMLWAASVLTGCSAGVEGVEADNGRVQVTTERALMGTSFRIDVMVEDASLGRAAIEASFAEVARTEEVLSNWSETSQISAVNRAAGLAPVVVSSELMTVLARANDISALTDGAFDVTFASCDGLWSIRERRIPADVNIAACLPFVDYREVALDHQSSAVYVPVSSIQIGVAGLAKGYRVDQAARILAEHGIEDFVVDGGGDMRVSTRANGSPWTITVANPRNADHPLGSVALSSGAVATSGDYEWFFERDGTRYHHIMDPATGRPARRSVSATVLAANAMDADALATALFVMGPDRGIALAERLPGVEAMVIAPDLRIHTSSGFPELDAPEEAS